MNNTHDTQFIFLVAGSCSGKSTAAKILKDEIKKNGATCSIVSGDLFYNAQKVQEMLESDTSKKIGFTPGRPDFDDVSVFNIRVLSECIKQLQNYQEITLPEYHYITIDQDKNVTTTKAEGSGTSVKPANFIIIDTIFSPELVTHIGKGHDINKDNIILLGISSSPDIVKKRREKRSGLTESKDIIEHVNKRAEYCKQWLAQGSKNYNIHQIQNDDSHANFQGKIQVFCKSITQEKSNRLQFRQY